MYLYLLLGIYCEGRKNIGQTLLEDAHCFAVFKTDAAVSLLYPFLRVQSKVKFSLNIHTQ